MVHMLVGLTVFFFVATLGQLVYLHTSILKAPVLNDSLLHLPDGTNLEASRLRAQVLLESNAIARRYHQANVLLMSRVWTGYLGFVTGMILALVGAVFILGKLQEGTSEVGGRMHGAEASLKTASPGLVLAFLGVVLMIITIVTHHEIETRDSPIYLTSSDLADDLFK